ncbi:hypothetical protein [Labrenzia sp. PHM005]|uniref:hypothetical protein n=1 Tax=Labrenzia sp. PHM005 TaxID=2590016 RepID=UPI001140743C|nr:hypothetical protein [Labrenzia sp. PHM005]QDG76711.1 hypothetical protein FJ695_12980 [Labrenzia sp. PHM005]
MQQEFAAARAEDVQRLALLEEKETEIVIQARQIKQVHAELGAEQQRNAALVQQNEKVESDLCELHDQLSAAKAEPKDKDKLVNEQDS